MCLLRALAEGRARPRDAAAPLYAEWVASRSFDIGATTSASLGCLRRPEHARRAEEIGVADAIAEAARMRCAASKANGSLMRISPLAVWAASRDRAAVVCAAGEDASLSHPTPSCVDAARAYVLAVSTLIRTGGDVAAALEAATTFVHAEAEPEVRTWLEESATDVEVPFTPLDGFVRIAFTHAFRHLRRGSSYEEAIAATLLGGGDTDTNACIVGGMVGARWGASRIPRAMRDAVLGCDTSKGGEPRPESYHPRDVPALVAKVLATSPTE